MKALPYYRWYPTDAESDAKYAAMTLAELGLYHRCLNHSWVNCGIPSDPYELGRELRLQVRDIQKLWPRVSVCFELSDSGRLVNRRQEEERTYAKTKSERATDAVRSRYGRSTDVGTNELPRAYESESESSICISSAKKKHAESDDWFESEFWPAWPVKQNKIAGKEAARKLTAEERPHVLIAVRMQSARIAAMERPIHASTWINKRRWEDETAPLLSFIGIQASNRPPAGLIGGD